MNKSFQMTAEKKQELLYNRLKLNGNLTESYINDQISTKKHKIIELQYDIDQIKMIKPIQEGYVQLFKSMTNLTSTQKIIGNINLPTMQIQTAAFTDAIYELIDELEKDILNLQVVKTKL